eukprot:2240983-Prymnesium_polylepis.1
MGAGMRATLTGARDVLCKGCWCRCVPVDDSILRECALIVGSNVHSCSAAASRSSCSSSRRLYLSSRPANCR